MIWHDIEQNDDYWRQLRCGKVTGSALGKIMANEGRAFGEPAKDYALQLALERVTNCPYENGFSNSHTERGHEQEPVARMLYEDAYFVDVTRGGFFDLGKIGASPDGLVCAGNGIIEIKSVIAKVHYATVKRGRVDPAYKWQVVGNLKHSWANWIDFISYCAEYPDGKQLFVYRVYRKDCRRLFRRIRARLVEFERLVHQRINELV